MATSLTAALLCACVAAAHAEPSPDEPIPDVVTADIKEGIEQHIESVKAEEGGFFPITFDGREMRLKLVRVHTEYLSNLGPRRHFACVDLVDTEGDVYDVDFFLEGDPGSMAVTKTSVHKLNGKPFYVWRQEDDGKWTHAEVDEASNRLLGVIEERDRFEFRYHVRLPELVADARMWIPLPTTDDFQTIEDTAMEVPGTHRILTDERYGNRVLFLELGPEHSGRVIDIRTVVDRREKSAYPGDNPEDFLGSYSLVPVNDRFRDIAAGVLEGKEQSDLVRARALYDHTIDQLRYMKHGDYGRGDAVYACDVATGNCTEFHSYFIALARSADIPARFAIGAAIPSSRDAGGIDGYHCWAEFYAEGKWWPIDISEGDKYSALATYYFGRHPANRVELSRGRDIVVEPGPESGPINFLAYPVLEVGGEPVRVTPQFGFRRLSDGANNSESSGSEE